MPLWWEENIHEQLLDPESVHCILPYMTKAISESQRFSELKHDPITATAIVFLTCPLQLGLTEVGAMLFQGHASLVYPYALMSERQKQFVRDCLGRRSEWNVYNNAILFRRSKEGPCRSVPQSTVLVALCNRLVSAASDRDPRSRLALCNIILQRLQGYVTIEKPVQRELNDWLSSRKDIKRQAQSKQQQAAT